MKFCKVSLLLALLVTVCLPAIAQTGIQVNVPFNFMVAGKSLPAGHYTIEPVFKSDSTAWRIYSGDATATVLTHPEPSTRSAHHPGMVFLRTGEGYALVQFWPEKHLRRDLTMPKVEHTLMAQRDKYVEIGTK